MSVDRLHTHARIPGMQLALINPRRACTRVTVIGLRVCVCVCVSVSVQHHESCHYIHATEYPTKGTHGFGAHVKCFVQKLWREKAKKLSMCLPRHHMAPMERHFARNCEDKAFSCSFKV